MWCIGNSLVDQRAAAQLRRVGEPAEPPCDRRAQVDGGRAVEGEERHRRVLAEWGEALHHWLVDNKIVVNHTFDYRLKYWIWGMFLLIALLSGFTVFELFSPPAIITRAAVYGTWISLGFIVLLLLIEILYSRRFWCRYICPVGTTYNFIGRLAPLKIKWDQNKCTNCKECQAVCMVPFVLADTVNRGKLEYVISGECTRCGLCVDACQDGALNYSIRYLDKIV